MRRTIGITKRVRECHRPVAPLRVFASRRGFRPYGGSTYLRVKFDRISTPRSAIQLIVADGNDEVVGEDREDEHLAVARLDEPRQRSHVGDRSGLRDGISFGARAAHARRDACRPCPAIGSVATNASRWRGIPVHVLEDRRHRRGRHVVVARQTRAVVHHVARRLGTPHDVERVSYREPATFGRAEPVRATRRAPSAASRRTGSGSPSSARSRSRAAAATRW